MTTTAAASARRRTSLATRVTLTFLGVALVAAAVAAASSTRLTGLLVEGDARADLAAAADRVAAAYDADPGADLAPLLVDGEELVVIGPSGVLPRGGGRAAVAARRAGAGAVADGATVSEEVRLGTATVLVEARPTTDGGGVALVREVRPVFESGPRLARTLLVSTAAGAVVAAVAGAVMAGFLARPLRRVTDVARGLRAGRRDVRVPVEGPREVAELGATVNELAETLQRSEARQREFLLSVSHELRTPLTGVAGFAESLADGVVTEPDEVRSAGRTIVREAARLERLVTDMLDLARLGADDFRLDLRDVDLARLVDDAAQVWAARCSGVGARLVVEADGPVVARTDALRIRQVLDGLAENALRVLAEGELLVLAARLEDGQDGRHAVLEVRDGGPGLTADDYAAAFERGVLHERYRGRRPVGSGIGLALVGGLVARLGGTVAAGPAAEGGAAFVVRLPA